VIGDLEEEKESSALLLGKSFFGVPGRVYKAPKGRKENALSPPILRGREREVFIKGNAPEDWLLSLLQKSPE